MEAVGKSPMLNGVRSFIMRKWNHDSRNAIVNSSPCPLRGEDERKNGYMQFLSFMLHHSQIDEWSLINEPLRTHFEYHHVPVSKSLVGNLDVECGFRLIL